ncbi:MAG: hypothetical protein ABIH42_01225, partial [Planctomycetota bacterium]
MKYKNLSGNLLNFFLIFTAFIFVLNSAVVADADEENIFPGFDTEEFGKNNFDAIYEECASYIAEHPDSPSAELAAYLLMDYENNFSDPDKLENVLETILQNKLSNGRNKEIFKNMLAAFYKKRGLKEKVEELNLTEGYVR